MVVPAVELLSVIVPAVPLKLGTVIELALRLRIPPLNVSPPVPKAVVLPSVERAEARWPIVAPE